MPEVQVILQGFSLGTNEGSAAFCSVTLVRGERTYLVDVAHPGRRRPLLDALASIGLTPDGIDGVFLTHSHWDHILNLDLFPNAEVILHRLELEYLQDPLPGDTATPRYTRRLLEDHRVRTVEDGERLEDGISVLLTPGHTRGSSTLLVDTGRGVAGIVGDALPTARSYYQGLPSLIIWSEDEARESIRKIAARVGVVYPGHDRPFRIAAGGTQYLGPLVITVTTPVDPGQENLAMTINSDQPDHLVTLKSVAPPSPLRLQRPSPADSLS